MTFHQQEQKEQYHSVCQSEVVDGGVQVRVQLQSAPRDTLLH